MGRDERDVVVDVGNLTDSRQDFYVEFSDPESGEQAVGRVVQTPPNTVVREQFSIRPSTYDFLVNVDDITPRPEETIEWTIEESNECENTRHCSLYSRNEAVELEILDRDCEGT